MYHEPEKYETLLNAWIKERTAYLENLTPKDLKRLFKNGAREFVIEWFEDVENLIEYKGVVG